MLQHFIHYFLHFIFPFFIAVGFYRKNRLVTYLVFLATMLVDADHLLAEPVYQACRCSIGFHPLHSYIACGIYALLLLIPQLRIVAIGLLLHMITDGIDCYMSSIYCK
ncbi:MAG: hypothetical protein KF862_14360 [Chitinophagaceae bacterium]|nr:hypothetical protein [Chitinophagaceae bacterium]